MKWNLVRVRVFVVKSLLSISFILDVSLNLSNSLVILLNFFHGLIIDVDVESDTFLVFVIFDQNFSEISIINYEFTTFFLALQVNSSNVCIIALGENIYLDNIRIDCSENFNKLILKQFVTFLFWFFKSASEQRDIRIYFSIVEV